MNFEIVVSILSAFGIKELIALAIAQRTSRRQHMLDLIEKLHEQLTTMAVDCAFRKVWNNYICTEAIINLSQAILTHKVLYYDRKVDDDVVNRIVALSGRVLEAQRDQDPNIATLVIQARTPLYELTNYFAPVIKKP